jgi:hypothetical protein
VWLGLTRTGSLLRLDLDSESVDTLGVFSDAMRAETQTYPWLIDPVTVAPGCARGDEAALGGGQAGTEPEQGTSGVVDHVHRTLDELANAHGDVDWWRSVTPAVVHRLV